MSITLESSNDPSAIQLFGGNKDAFKSREKFVILVGGGGTGKTIALTLKMHLYAMVYPGVKILLCRKSLPALRNSAVKTYLKVLEMTGMADKVRILGETRPTNFIYPYSENEVDGVLYKGISDITLSQIDSKGKALGAEYDLIYISQPETEGLSEAEFTLISSRARLSNAPYRQILADPNPSSQDHFLLKGMEDGKWKFYQSIHEDNPALYNSNTREWTDLGKEHLAQLDMLPDYMKESQLYGRWYSLDGTIFQKEWKDSFILSLYSEESQLLGISEQNENGEFVNCVPQWWDHYLAIDYGGTTSDPFAALLIVHHPNIDKFIVHKHIYSGEKDIFEVSQLTKEMCEGYNIKAIIADRGRAETSTMERYLGQQIITAKKGNNSVQPNINICMAQLNADKWRFVQTLESLVHEPDIELSRLKKPMGLVEELPNLKRDDKTGGIAKRQADHAFDAWRYFCKWYAEEHGGAKRKETVLWLD